MYIFESPLWPLYHDVLDLPQNTCKEVNKQPSGMLGWGTHTVCLLFEVPSLVHMLYPCDICDLSFVWQTM